MVNDAIKMDVIYSYNDTSMDIDFTSTKDLLDVGWGTNVSGSRVAVFGIEPTTSNNEMNGIVSEFAAAFGAQKKVADRNRTQNFGMKW